MNFLVLSDAIRILPTPAPLFYGSRYRSSHSSFFSPPDGDWARAGCEVSWWSSLLRRIGRALFSPSLARILPAQMMGGEIVLGYRGTDFLPRLPPPFFFSEKRNAPLSLETAFLFFSFFALPPPSDEVAPSCFSPSIFSSLLFKGWPDQTIFFLRRSPLPWSIFRAAFPDRPSLPSPLTASSTFFFPFRTFPPCAQNPIALPERIAPPPSAVLLLRAFSGATFFLSYSPFVFYIVAQTRVALFVASERAPTYSLVTLSPSKWWTACNFFFLDLGPLHFSKRRCGAAPFFWNPTNSLSKCS